MMIGTVLVNLLRGNDGGISFCDNRIHLPHADQLGCESWQFCVLALGTTPFDSDILPSM
jgi:hypothetical protein